MFAIEKVLCGNITSNTSNSISITLHTTEQIRVTTGTLHSGENQGTGNLNTTDNLSLYPTKNWGTHILDTTEIFSIHKAATNTVYIISIGSLAAALTVSIAISLTVIFVKRSTSCKTRIKHSNNTEEPVHDEPMYEDITGALSSVSTINTQDNIAYHHTGTKTSTLTKD